MADDEGEDFWYDLLAHIEDQVLVPITGPDLNVVTSDETGHTLARLIARRLVDSYDLKMSDDHLTMREAVGAALRRNRRNADRLYKEVNKIIGEFAEHECVPLREIAEITDLRLFVSMTPDRLLAKTIRKVRPSEQIHELTFFPGQSTADRVLNLNLPEESDTFVVRLFGQAASTAQYAIHDEDLLEWMHSLMDGGGGLPESIAHALRHQPLLFIGYDTPDWLLRFLLRLCNTTRMSSSESKQFFLVNTAATAEPLFDKFLATYCPPMKVQQLNMTASDFVTELHRRWTEQVLWKRSAPKAGVLRPGIRRHGPSTRPTVFISYLREDVDAARRLYNQVNAICGDVWFDEKGLSPGDWWSDKIPQAIKRCHLFLAIISANTEVEEEGYVFREWQLAVDRLPSIAPGSDRRFIIPVIVDDPPGPAGDYLCIPKEFREFDFGNAPRGELDSSLREVLEKEIRAIRRPGAA